MLPTLRLGGCDEKEQPSFLLQQMLEDCADDPKPHFATATEEINMKLWERIFIPMFLLVFGNTILIIVSHALMYQLVDVDLRNILVAFGIIHTTIGCSIIAYIIYHTMKIRRATKC